jgi:hypothetical protein
MSWRIAKAPGGWVRWLKVRMTSMPWEVGWVSTREAQDIAADNQALKIVQITRPTSGEDTPVSAEQAGRRKAQREQALGKGPCGVGVTEVVNLWRGSMAVGKGVNDVTWGAGGEFGCTFGLTPAFAHKVVTASPSGSFLLFDLNRGKLGTSGRSGSAHC